VKSISIIIPVWNGAPFIGACLRSIQPQLQPGDEVIAVDNGSTDGSAELIARDFGWVQLVRAGRNLGYGGGANLALLRARGAALLIMNQDVELLADCLVAIRHRLAADGPCLVGGKLLYPDRQTVQHAGGIIHLPRAVADHAGYRQRDDGRFEALSEPDYVTGALLAIDRVIVEAIGGFDDGFSPAYYEEVDFCYRARAAGFRVIYDPTVTALHHETQSDPQRSFAYHRLMERGRLRFVLKHFTPDQFEAFWSAEQTWVHQTTPEFARQVGVPVYNYMLSHLPELPAARAAACLDHLRQLRQAARHVAHSEVAMSQAFTPLQVPPLREHEFGSNVPVIGPLIVRVRRALYSLTAKWPLVVALDQQNRINQQFTQRLLEYEARLAEYAAQLREYDERLIDQDRDLAHLSRVVAETELRQRQLTLPRS